MSDDLSKYYQIINKAETIKTKGKVSQIVGLTVESIGPPSACGDQCYILTSSKGPLKVEVVGFKSETNILMPLGSMEGISPGDEVVNAGKPFGVKVGENLRGRVLNALGEPIDDKGKITLSLEYPLVATPPSALSRDRIKEILPLGIKSIDGLTTCGKGQRLGIFSGSGVGKSLLLGQIARNTSADINVIALVGERGREVRDFIERDLQEEGLSRSVVVVATSDMPALLRVKAAFTAHAIAEYFRDEGRDVMLMMDSVTRLCFAQREIGLAIGEPPATKGYPPSVYALLPQLLERSGTSDKGSITGLYTVLVEGDDMSDVVADQVRSILDGHIVLSRELSNIGHYPAVDILQSISRVMFDIVTPSHRKLAEKLRETLAIYRDSHDLINIGAYVRGSSPKIDYAIEKLPEINSFLRQDVFEKVNFPEMEEHLQKIFK